MVCVWLLMHFCPFSLFGHYIYLSKYLVVLPSDFLQSATKEKKEKKKGKEKKNHKWSCLFTFIFIHYPLYMEKNKYKHEKKIVNITASIIAKRGKGGYSTQQQCTKEETNVFVLSTKQFKKTRRIIDKSNARKKK